MLLTKEILNIYLNLKTLFKTSSVNLKKPLWSKISKEAANKGLSKLSTEASTATKAKQAILKQDVLNTHLNLKSLFQKSNVIMIFINYHHIIMLILILIKLVGILQAV